MDTQYFKELLHKRSLKATSHRLNLLQTIQAFKSAMPYSAIQASLKSIDRVTLYRTIESLKEQGIIHKAFQENNEIYYAICGNECSQDDHRHDHIHFRCTNCESVTCEETRKSINISLPDYQIEKVSILLEGVCKECK